MNIKARGLAIITVILFHPGYAQDLLGKAKEPSVKKDSGHDHEHEHGKDEGEFSEAGHEHGKEENHGDERGEHGHDHGEEKNSNVGPDKGVTAADEDKGFVIKSKVETNFAIKTQKIVGSIGVLVPRSALLFSGMEKQVYRNRDNCWKAVDVTIVKKQKDTFEIRSKDLAAGDSIAITGVGFLKIIEQSVFGPAIEGHVH